MKILYIHGLNSIISSESNQRKINFLENFGKVFAPQLDYNHKQEFQNLELYFKNNKIDLIIGSSMGGFMGYHLSKKYSSKSILFNPALFKRSVEQKIDDYKNKPSNINIILGGKDQIINPIDTLLFLKNDIIQDYKINLINNLEHQIPFNIFEKVILEII